MKTNAIKYEFTARPWLYEGKGGWCFVSLPVKLAQEIRSNLKWQEEGWGRMKATAKIGNTEWPTAIWFDTKLNTYLLPLKAAVRKKEKLEAGAKVKVMVFI